MRAQARQARSGIDGGEECPIPMTVRQLEALVRISESFARMALAAEADDGAVAAAFELFTKSTLNAMNAGLINSSERLEVRGQAGLGPAPWLRWRARSCVRGRRQGPMRPTQGACLPRAQAPVPASRQCGCCCRRLLPAACCPPPPPPLPGVRAAGVCDAGGGGPHL